MKIKTSELTGPALRWAVLVANVEPEKRDRVVYALNKPGAAWPLINAFHPDTDWSQGGPILQNHISALLDCADSGWEACCCGVYEVGDTALEAVCRAYVAAKLGEEVEVPDELC